MGTLHRIFRSRSVDRFARYTPTPLLSKRTLSSNYVNGSINYDMLLLMNDGSSTYERREDEKHQLAKLNDKFASYIDKIILLEADSKTLDMRLESYQKFLDD
ncbi:unnamed protein product, partial [Didymodactylos carnosus]